MHRSWLLIASVAAIAVVASAFPVSAADVSFLSFDEDISIEDVSADGSTIVGYLGSSLQPQEAIRWRLGEEMLGLGVGPFKYTYATSISGDGKIVGGFARVKDAGAGSRYFLWTEESGLQFDGGVPPSAPTALSFDGTVAVGASPPSAPNGFLAYRWTAATGVEYLGDLPGGTVASYARGVSDDGTIIVGDSSIDRNVAAFRWTAEEGMVQLPGLTPSVPWGRAWAISPDGVTIAGTSGNEAVIWEGFEVTVLGRLADQEGTPLAKDVSNGGKVVVGSQGRIQDTTAFRWTKQTGMKSLASLLAMGGIDMTGWHLLSATKVSSDGTVIVGHAITPSGYYRGYVATVPVDFVPEPNSAWLFAGAICSLAFYRRKNCSWKSGGCSSDLRP